MKSFFVFAVLFVSPVLALASKNPSVPIAGTYELQAIKCSDNSLPDDGLDATWAATATFSDSMSYDVFFSAKDSVPDCWRTMHEQGAYQLIGDHLRTVPTSMMDACGTQWNGATTEVRYSLSADKQTLTLIEDSVWNSGCPDGTMGLTIYKRIP